MFKSTLSIEKDEILIESVKNLKIIDSVIDNKNICFFEWFNEDNREEVIQNPTISGELCQESNLRNDRETPHVILYKFKSIWNILSDFSANKCENT